LDGILNINKPAGKTSFGVVAIVKRLTGERRAGHAGTLDPDATGILPVCLGKATRIVEFLQDAHKVYRTDIELGITTDSYDGAGKIIARGDVSAIDKPVLEKALEAFRGTIQQTPPMHSALKHEGQPLYTLARAGITVERKNRPVTIHRLELLAWQPPLVTLEIECSKGTYIRSIANDLGEKLGCGAYMKNLIRTAYGNFNIQNSISMQQLEEAVSTGDWEKYLYPIDSVLGNLPSVTVDETGEEAIKVGSPPDIEEKIQETRYNDQTPQPFPPAGYIRAYNKDGLFLAILRYDPDENKWRPKKVFI